MTKLDDLQAASSALVAENATLTTKVDALIVQGNLVLDALRALQAAGTGVDPAALQPIIDQLTGAVTAAKAEEAKVDAAAGTLVP